MGAGALDFQPLPLSLPRHPQTPLWASTLHTQFSGTPSGIQCQTRPIRAKAEKKKKKPASRAIKSYTGITLDFWIFQGSELFTQLLPVSS